MIWITGHPGYRRLNRFADRALASGELGRVAEHLATCARCRREVSFIRRTAEVARAIGSPPASDRLLQEVIARRRSGDRVLLPLADVGEAPTPRRLVMPATVAALFTMVLGGLLFSAPVLEADRAGLRLAPERVTAGGRVTVEYRATQLFADRSQLKLRARYRSADHAQWQLVAGILTRDRDGIFRTRLTLPDSVVYAAFAVEDMEGERLDSRNRKLWDLLVHDSTGSPTLAALGARAEDLLLRDWGAAYRTGLRMTELYPDAPQAWLTRLATEQGIFDPDSLRDAYRARYPELERAALTEPVRVEQLAWLAGLAVTLGNPESAERVLREAERRPGPPPPMLIRAQVLGQAVRSREPVTLLRELEAIWIRYGTMPLEAMRTAVATAARTDDAAAVERWLDRYLTLGYDWPIAGYLAHRFGDLDPELIRRLEAHHRALLDPADDGRRPLRLTLREYRRLTRATLQSVLTPLAELAGTADQPARAIDLAREATTLSWDTPSLERLGAVLLAAGDSAGATVAYARALADPIGGATPVVVRSRADWPARVVEARYELERYVMDGSVIRYPDPTATIESDGQRTHLGSLLRGRPVVVAFTSSYSAPALAELGGLARLMHRIGPAQADLLVVSLSPGDAEPGDPLPARLPAASVVTDPEGDLQSTFRSSGTPNYFVLDESGRIRFENSELAEVPRQLEALRLRRPAVSVVAD